MIPHHIICSDEVNLLGDGNGVLFLGAAAISSSSSVELWTVQYIYIFEMLTRMLLTLGLGFRAWLLRFEF